MHQNGHCQNWKWIGWNGVTAPLHLGQSAMPMYVLSFFCVWCICKGEVNVTAMFCNGTAKWDNFHHPTLCSPPRPKATVIMHVNVKWSTSKLHNPRNALLESRDGEGKG